MWSYKSNSFVTKDQKLLQLFNTTAQVKRLTTTKYFVQIFCLYFVQDCIYHFSLKFNSTLILCDIDFSRNIDIVNSI